jgi:hypothetical protein
MWELISSPIQWCNTRADNSYKKIYFTKKYKIDCNLLKMRENNFVNNFRKDLFQA